VALAIEKQIESINHPVRERMRRLFGVKKAPFEVYGLLSEFMNVEGKLLRPALCLASCEAVGGRREDAAPAAAAIEMFHNFTLIHDDIEDASQLRRGRPCMHVKYGLPLALNAGDGLFMMVWREALEMKGPKKEEAQKRLLSAFTRVLEGQAIELGWYNDRNWDVGEGDYRAVVEGKTGALIAAACEVGGLMGGADEKTCKALREFGLGIGVGFQIIDDVLNVSGDVEKYGKEIGGDIVEGKRTLMTIRAMKSLPKQRKNRLHQIMAKEGKNQEDVVEAIALLEESGAIKSAAATADAEIANALSKLGGLPKTQSRAFLLQLAQYITKRDK